MNNAVYLEIIKKQQELIDLMIQAGVYENTELLSNKSKEVKCDINGFAEWLIKEGLSQNCIDTYTTGIKLFLKEYGEITFETLADYEKSLGELSPKTANVRIAGMKRYLKFIGFSGYEFKQIKEQKKTFCNNAINEQQYKKLMDWAKDKSPKTWLICKVISSTGVRVSELICLKTADLDKGYADITGKGNKRRRIYFSKSMIDEIKDYCGELYIVTNRYGKQMTTGGVAQLIRTAGIKAGIPKEVMHPHSFRHFFAKQFLKKKNDITLLGDLLGHSNVATTAIYTRMTAEEQQKEINSIVNW